MCLPTENADYLLINELASKFGRMLSIGAILLKIGSALADRVGRGDVGGCTALANSAWWLLQLAMERAWSALDATIFCFLVQMCVENSPFTL